MAALRSKTPRQKEIGSVAGKIRTCDLQVISLTSYRAAPPRDKAVARFLRGELDAGNQIEPSSKRQF